MKPSERIAEINNNLPFKGLEVQEGVRQFASYEGAINTIIQYLDEEYERNKLCEHLYESGYVCKKCGFSMIQPV